MVPVLNNRFGTLLHTMETTPATVRRAEYFKFNLSDRVMVTEIQRPGRVTALIIDNLGVQYQVALWDNGDRKNIWLFEDEITSRG